MEYLLADPTYSQIGETIRTHSYPDFINQSQELQNQSTLFARYEAKAKRERAESQRQFCDEMRALYFEIEKTALEESDDEDEIFSKPTSYSMPFSSPKNLGSYKVDLLKKNEEEASGDDEGKILLLNLLLTFCDDRGLKTVEI